MICLLVPREAINTKHYSVSNANSKRISFYQLMTCNIKLDSNHSSTSVSCEYTVYGPKYTAIHIQTEVSVVFFILVTGLHTNINLRADFINLNTA